MASIPDPMVLGGLVALVVSLILIAHYGYGLPVLFGSLLMPPVAGLSLGVAYLLQIQFGFELTQTLALVGGGMVAVTVGYLAVPYTRRLVVTLRNGARTALSLVLTIVVPWRLAHWLRTLRS